MAGEFEQVSLIIGGHVVLEEFAQLVALLHQTGGGETDKCLGVRHEELLGVEVLLLQMLGHNLHKTLVDRMTELKPVILERAYYELSYCHILILALFILVLAHYLAAVSYYEL